MAQPITCIQTQVIKVELGYVKQLRAKPKYSMCTVKLIKVPS